VEIKAANVDKAWLLPGADFRPYNKVLLRKADVAFQRNWLRDINREGSYRTNRIQPEDAQKIVDLARTGFDQVWAAVTTSYPAALKTAAGDGVLEVVPRVTDLYINAPAVSSTRPSRTYTVEAGEAALHMDVRDSRAGTLLGRVFDHRKTTSATRAQITDAMVNRAEFEQLFVAWARIAAKGLDDLKAASPLPETLQAGKKVPVSR
jgi:hypothetical protein